MIPPSPSQPSRKEPFTLLQMGRDAFFALCVQCISVLNTNTDLICITIMQLMQFTSIRCPLPSYFLHRLTNAHCLLLSSSLLLSLFPPSSFSLPRLGSRHLVKPNRQMQGLQQQQRTFASSWNSKPLTFEVLSCRQQGNLFQCFIKLTAVEMHLECMCTAEPSLQSEFLKLYCSEGIEGGCCPKREHCRH